MGRNVFLHVEDELLIDRAAKALAQWYLGRVKGTYVAMLKEEMYSRKTLRSIDGSTIDPMVWSIIQNRAKVIQKEIERQEAEYNVNSGN